MIMLVEPFVPDVCPDCGDLLQRMNVMEDDELGFNTLSCMNPFCEYITSIVKIEDY